MTEMTKDEKLIMAMNKIVREAETWIGTPYRWNCKIKGEKGGVSCGDLIEMIFKNAGCLRKNYKTPTVYRDWHMKPADMVDQKLFAKEVLKFTNPIDDWEQRRPTDVAMMSWSGSE